MKGTWKIIRQALNSKQKSQGPSSLLVDGVLTEDNVKMSDAFNQFFSSIGNQLSTNLPASRKKKFMITSVIKSLIRVSLLLL